jgi:hypothetical protein
MNETALETALADGFESGALAPGDFHHRDHVRLAWVYLRRYGRDDAERRLLEGLRAFAMRAGKAEKFDAPLTRRWVALIDQARQSAGAQSFETLIAAHPELLDPATARREVPHDPHADAAREAGPPKVEG